jgi:hypothetical protein
MTAKQIVNVLGDMFNGVWKRHLVNLALMVFAVSEVRRLSVTAIGRGHRGRTAPKHSIKRFDRFLSNPRFDDRTAQEALLCAVIGNRTRVLVAVDWTKYREWPALVASVVHRGRGVPVMWSVMDGNKLYKSQNAFEHGFFKWLKSALPRGVQAIVLLDRGFKRVELARQLSRLGLDFVIRTGNNVHVRSSQYVGPIEGLVLHRGQVVDVPDAAMRTDRPVRVRVVGLWERKQREPWLLMTSLTKESVAELARMYGKRFRIEETFRDEKDARFGLYLGHVKVTRADRLERLMLIAALVHFFAMLIGAEARRQGLDRGFRANTVRHKATHSDFTLGIYYFSRLRVNFALSLRLFLVEAQEVFGG